MNTSINFKKLFEERKKKAIEMWDNADRLYNLYPDDLYYTLCSIITAVQDAKINSTL
jgi:hypothetical protein